MDFSVVIPARNEAQNVEPIVTELADVLEGRSYEIVYIDDGSTDETFSELVRVRAALPQLRVIRLDSSVGQSTAIWTGVSASEGRLIVTLDADGQNDPRDIPTLLDAAEQFPRDGHFCIAGYRKNRRDTRWKRFQSRFANRIRAALLRDGTPDTGCALKVIPRRTFLRLPYFDHMHRFLPALIKRQGGTVVVVEVNHRERMAGSSKYTMLNRAFVGLVDMLGVMWLQRRARSPVILDQR